MMIEIRDQDGLTARQKSVVLTYLADPARNQTAAYLQHYPESNRKAAKVESCRLFKIPEVQRFIERELKADNEHQQITRERIAREMAKAAFVDIGQLFDEQGALLSFEEMDESVRRAVASIDVSEEYEGRGDDKKFTGYTKKIRMVPKAEMLNSLARYRGMFTDTVRIENDALAKVLARTAQESVGPPSERGSAGGPDLETE